MKIAVLYYSFEGNTHKAAETIAEATGAELIRISPQKEIPTNKLKYLLGGFQAITKKCPKLNEIEQDLSQYDLLFIGTPVWASTITPPIRSLLKENDFSNMKVALFSCFGGEYGKSIDQMKELLSSATIVDQGTFVDPAKPKNERYLKKINRWATSIIEEL